MDGAVGAVIALAVVSGGLVAWRWWLADKTAGRAHELEMRKQVVAVEQKTLDGLAGRMATLEDRVTQLGWKKG